MGITLTDVLLFGKAQSDDVDNATLVIYRRNILRWSALGGYLDVIVKGVSPLSLPDAVANTLSYVKAFGGTEQNGTPTPTNPIDIVSNNGVLKYGFNYYSYNVTRQLSVANYPVELDRSISYSDGVLTCSITDSVSSNKGLYPTWDMSFTAGHKYACVVMAKGDARINLGLASIIPSGSVTGGSSSDGFYTLTSNYVWYAKRWECNTDSSARLNIRVAGTDVGQYASFKDILVIDLTAIFGAGNEPTTSSDIIQRTVEIYTDGTVETIADSANHTATVATLLGVGDYRDTQNINTGAITRNVGVKVLDGTENWETTSQPAVYRWESPVLFSLPNVCICSHYAGVSTDLSISNMPDMSAKTGFAGNSNVYIKDSSFSGNLTGFKQSLAAQYAAGTPVMIVYPLATETTESVAGQTLQVQDGDNTLEITQASLNGLELEAQYQAAVSLTIQEVQDANLDPNVEVTIN